MTYRASRPAMKHSDANVRRSVCGVTLAGSSSRPSAARFMFALAQASLTTGAHLRVIGKGDKERCAILTNETVAVLRASLRERQGQPHQPLFPTRRGEPLTTRAFE